ncbi:MAG: transposase [Thiotrichaceae bacterium]|nr:transposase [Thiotrichaceae bacterium]
MRVRLNGQFEVLVTSLCDETLYPTADFKELYRLRWKVETFFSVSYQAKKPAILNM